MSENSRIKRIREQLRRIGIEKGITVTDLLSTDQSVVWLSFLSGSGISKNIERAYKLNAFAVLPEIPTGSSSKKVLDALDATGHRLTDHSLWPLHLEG